MRSTRGQCCRTRVPAGAEMTVVSGHSTPIFSRLEPNNFRRFIAIKRNPRRQSPLHPAGQESYSLPRAVAVIVDNGLTRVHPEDHFVPTILSVLACCNDLVMAVVGMPAAVILPRRVNPLPEGDNGAVLSTHYSIEVHVPPTHRS
jgi:hypothetical protein